MSTDEPEHLTPMQRRAAELASLTQALAERGERPLSEADLASVMVTGDLQIPSWIDDLLFLLSRAQFSTLGVLSEVCGVNRATLMKWRRKVPQLEVACKDYLAATFEDEMELPHRQIRPGVLLMAAERLIPTFMKDAEGKISEEDVALLVRAILDSIRTRLAATGMDDDVVTQTCQFVASDITHEFEKRKVD